MKMPQLLALCLVMLLLFTACGGEKTEEQVNFGSESDTTAEPASGEETLGESDSEYETFFSVEEYDYTGETDPDILAYFHNDIGGALTRLAPSAKAVAYAAFCYPSSLISEPTDEAVWCALYSMVVSFHQLPEGSETTESGQTVIHGSDKLESMAAGMFTSHIGKLGTPHEDFLDSLIVYDAATDTYTFEPSGGEGLEIRICALEAAGDDAMGLTVQLYNSIFDFTSWVSLKITRNDASPYGYTVSGATAWNEDFVD